ncbi:hypothetical protein ACFORJ_08305 [Corynebacterium hansenii]|uniref:Secreted protein n=2 Tax=Corynebacterium hansenii TaxID=394964 RepID=A0ABV7ZPR8_9CORY
MTEFLITWGAALLTAAAFAGYAALAVNREVRGPGRRDRATPRGRWLTAAVAVTAIACAAALILRLAELS